MNTIRTRYAPSPTGNPHIGNIRTALFAYLFAKKNNGAFILRLEDTDRERYVEKGLEYIIDSLAWLGMKPDEGPGFGGEYGPYIQSERLAIYQKHAQELVEKNFAYFCFCTQERLAELRESQARQKLAPRYDRHCLHLSEEEVIMKKQNNLPFVIRMRVPDDEILSWNDLVRGEVSFASKDIDDQVLVKSDRFPTYHLANVIDDALMKVSHVIRADEWISSTPKHLLLYRFFGWNPPLFAHLPLILNEKRAKLSKRDGEVAVLAYRDLGYLPEAVLNFIAFLGWNPKTDQEFFTLDELINAFELSGVNKAGAVFNIQKLNWFNKHAIRKKSFEELTKLCLPYLEQLGLDSVGNDEFVFGPSGKRLSRYDLERMIGLFADRMQTTAEIKELIGFLLVDLPSYDPYLLSWKGEDVASAKHHLQNLYKELYAYDGEWSKQALEAHFLSWIQALELKNGPVLWPLRVSLSGLQNSPGPFEIAELLGKDETLKRVAHAVEK